MRKSWYGAFRVAQSVAEGGCITLFVDRLNESRTVGLLAGVTSVGLKS